MPSLLRLTRTRIFSYLTSAHIQKAFCGGSKIEQFCPHFCTHKVQSAVVSHTQSDEAAVAEAAREDVNLLHVPEPWHCYRIMPLHLPCPHHQCVSASRSDYSCLYPYFTYSCSQETYTRDWLTLGGIYISWYEMEPKAFQSLLVNNRCSPTELSKTLIQKIKKGITISQNIVI